MNYSNFERHINKPNIFNWHYIAQAKGSFNFNLNFRLEESSLRFLTDDNWNLSADNINNKISKSINLKVLDFIKIINNMSNSSDEKDTHKLIMYQDNNPYLELSIYKTTKNDKAIFEIKDVEVANSLKDKFGVLNDKNNQNTHQNSDAIQNIEDLFKNTDIWLTPFVQTNPVSTTLGKDNNVGLFKKTDKSLQSLNFKKIVARYAHNIYVMTDGNKNKDTFKKIKPQLIDNVSYLQKALLLGYDFKNNNLIVKQGKFYATSSKLVNVGFTSGALASKGAIAYTEDDFNQQKEMLNNLPVAQQVIPYDLNGNRVQTGNWSFDNEVLTRYNALNMMAPQKDINYVFINGIVNPVQNKVFTINKLTIGNKDIYFDKFANLEDYLLKYIENNVIRKDR